MTNIDEEVNKYIRCHELQTACACDGACDDCEFDISETSRTALEKLHEHTGENNL